MMRLAFLACAAALALVAPAYAQDVSDDPPAHISVVDGTVVLERDGRSETAPASMPLLAGDRLRTQDGRAEVLFADGSTLHLDTGTIVDFQSDDVIRLLDGRVRVSITPQARDVNYRVDAPSAWVQIAQPGEYRVAILRAGSQPDVELAVLRGSADLVNESGRTALRAGERAFARVNEAPSAPYVFNSASWDAFDRWSEARRDERLGQSAQYLPDNVRYYSSTFDRYGSWRYEPTYGYVWYPTVAVGWRPYYYGRWTTLRPWGWTWIGTDPWAWPTHHYGRWGFSAGVWFWIPGRTWGPAWVSWAYAPGYVSWCPLGWNNRPVFSFVSVNVFGGHHYDPWHAWTVVPRRHFGSGYVNRTVVSASYIDARTRGAFSAGNRPPEITGYAVPRATAPIRVAGARVARVPGAATSYATPAAGGRAYTAPRSTGVDDAAATFRSRRPQSSTPVGPGLPATGGRARSGAVLRVPPSATAPAAAAPGAAAANARERRGNAPGSGGAATPPERRAVPREGAIPAPGRPQGVAPSYAPGSSMPSAPGTMRVNPPATPRSAPDSSAPDRYRAVPRSYRGDYGVRPSAPNYGQPRRAPDSSNAYGAAPSAPSGNYAQPRSAPGAPNPYGGMRPGPGGAPGAAAPSPGPYRSYGTERRGPSPGPQAAPPPSGGRSGGEGRAGARAPSGGGRGGGGARTGTAVPRGGGRGGG